MTFRIDRWLVGRNGCPVGPALVDMAGGYQPDAGHEVRGRFLMPGPSADTGGLVAASAVLRRLHDEAPTDHFTLGWLMHRLHKRSFGIIMLLIALVAIAPGLSIVAGLLLLIPAFQMVMGKPAPVFPHGIATRALPTRQLAAVVQRSIPVLRYLEKAVHPRWQTPPEATKRLVGAVVVLLSSTLVFIPIPLSNVIPALAIALISLAYLEEDGVLLAVAVLAAVIVLTVATAAVWEIVVGAKWIAGLW
jgi:hypothetical protein